MRFGWTRYNYRSMLAQLLSTKPISTGEWQSMNVGDSKPHMTHELEDVTFIIPSIPDTKEALEQLVMPDVPWAEDHFQERVSGIPHNPPPSHEYWPHAVRGNDDHLRAGLMFDHTYPERFWPKHAGHQTCPVIYDKDQHSNSFHCDYVQYSCGIRFDYGDLSDVVDLLTRSPLTRQAYLPVWFPEDTGAVQGQRVPCTLGYHFMIRDGRLSCRYFIRSCDVMRHLTNDVYLACRLTQWMVQQVNERWDTEGVPKGHPLSVKLTVGKLVMHVSSLHAFVGDVPKLRERIHAR